MIKVIHIVGARPQFMKLMPLYRKLKSKSFYQEILHTGQHFDVNMSKVFFDELEIPSPDYNLNINSLSHGAMTGKMIQKIEEIITNKKYDYVIVYGDTNSTLAGAIASKKCKIKLVHIEAGVRNYDMDMPEEINRVITDRVSDLLFCPTKKAYLNLEEEGYKKLSSNFYNSGDLMFDTLKLSLTKIKKINLENFILLTIHRAENLLEKNLKSIIESVNEISKEIKVIFPIHPSTKNKLKEYNIKPVFELIEPQGYFDFLGLLANCKFLITDSGGALRESYWLKKPSLSILNQPVWPELNEAGVSINSIANKESILNSYKSLEHIDISRNIEIFGNGEAARLIVDHIINNYENQ